MNLYDFIVNVPDFPQKGIQFKDISNLLKDAGAFKFSIEHNIIQQIDKFLKPSSLFIFILTKIIAH